MTIDELAATSDEALRARYAAEGVDVEGLVEWMMRTWREKWERSMGGDRGE